MIQIGCVNNDWLGATGMWREYRWETMDENIWHIFQHRNIFCEEGLLEGQYLKLEVMINTHNY